MPTLQAHASDKYNNNTTPNGIREPFQALIFANQLKQLWFEVRTGGPHSIGVVRCTDRHIHTECGMLPVARKNRVPARFLRFEYPVSCYTC